RGGLNTIVLLKQQDAETVIARVLQGKAILRFVHSEATWTARAGGEKDVVVDNLLPGHTAGFQPLEVSNKDAHGKVGRIALPVVALLLTQRKAHTVGNGKNSATISAPFNTA